MGYPGIDLDENGDEVHGFLFSSEELSGIWPKLDEFEGQAYERVLTVATLIGNKKIDAYIYKLR